MNKKKQSILLLVLFVLLLVVISTRVSPRQPGSINDPKTTEPNLEAVEPTPEVTPPPVEPEPQKPIRELLPDLSLNDWNLKLVNNTYILARDFAPDVSKIQDEQYFDSRAVEYLNAMLDAAKEAGHTVCVRTAYRPYATQAYLFNGRASQIQWGTTMTLMEAEMKAREIVAYPGTSEHQLGLCVDLMDSADSSMSVETAEKLPLIQWLQEHCAEYGFILRYPKDKQERTGWYEPWHFRYVGETAAKYIMENDLCLEEFVERF